MDITLLDRDLYATGPDEAFTWLRANEPVYRDPEGIWGLTLHEDITWAERQPTVFSNSGGSRPRGRAARRAPGASTPTAASCWCASGWTGCSTPAARSSS